MQFDVKLKMPIGLSNKDQNRYVACSTPFRCFENIPIDIYVFASSIKIKCSNKHCNTDKYMHLSCFRVWSENIITQIHNYANYMPKEFIQMNLWNPQHFNLNIPICQCKCRIGHLRIEDKYREILGANNNLSTTVPCLDKHLLNDPMRFRKESNSSLSLSSFEDTYSPMNSYMPNISSIIKKDGSKINLNKHTMPLKGPVKYSSIVHNSTDSIDDTTSGVSSLHPSEMYNQKQSLANSTHSREISSLTDSSNENETDKEFLHRHNDKFSKIQIEDDINIETNIHFYKSSALSPLGTPYTAPIGCIFKRRSNFVKFNQILPRLLVNSYHIKTEDEGPHGNDETRYTLLTKFSSINLTVIPCAFCGEKMDIYDRYPLIDGILFVSPVNYYNKSVNDHYSPHKTPVGASQHWANQSSALAEPFEIQFKLDTSCGGVGNSNNPNLHKTSLNGSNYGQNSATNNNNYPGWNNNLHTNDYGNFRQNGHEQTTTTFLNAICVSCASAAKTYDSIKKDWSMMQKLLNQDRDSLQKSSSKACYLSSLINLLHELLNDSTTGTGDPKGVEEEAIDKIPDFALKILMCSFCQKPWDGSKFTLGTLYSYDIFNALPCCRDRLSCKTCCNTISLTEPFLTLPSDHWTNPPPFSPYISSFAATGPGLNAGDCDINSNLNVPSYDPSFVSNNTCKPPGSLSANNNQSNPCNNNSYTNFNFRTPSPTLGPNSLTLNGSHDLQLYPGTTPIRSSPNLGHTAVANFYSQFSKKIKCPYCQTYDYHYVKKDRHDLINVKLPETVVKTLCLF